MIIYRYFFFQSYFLLSLNIDNLFIFCNRMFRHTNTTLLLIQDMVVDGAWCYQQPRRKILQLIFYKSAT